MNMNRCGRVLMPALALTLLAAVAAGTARAQMSAAQDEKTPIKLTGAGASFPAPLYLRWFRDYYKEHPSIKIDYQSTSSSGGINDLINDRIDFAGSDLRLNDAQQGQVRGGVRQVPMTAGAIVLVYNIDGVTDLQLSRDAVVGI
ncbi:MAG: substrate-binding domain-containing protein, partial [Thiohalocapsa sp.]